MNNDNYDDVIVGTSGYSSYTGRATIYFGGSSMDNTADVILTGETTSDYFGYSVSGAGDVNNDNYDDVIVGADGYSSNTGRAYVYFGGSSMNNTADVTLTGEGIDNHFGRSVSGAGDVNNDGVDEIIIGAYNFGPMNNGKVYIYSINSDFQDIETVNATGMYTFNEGGDGHPIDMNFTSLTGSGNVTVGQTNLSPSSAPCNNVCDFYWDITKDESISDFSADVTFHYTDTDASGYTESNAYFGIAKFNTSTNTWTWLGGTMNAGANTITVSSVTSFSTFALFRRIFGDANGDGYVDAADLQNLGDCWHQTNSGEFDSGCDAHFFNTNKNTDGGNQIIDAADLQIFGDCWHNGVAP